MALVPLLAPLVRPFVCSAFSFERPILVENLRSILPYDLANRSTTKVVEERVTTYGKKHEGWFCYLADQARVLYYQLHKIPVGGRPPRHAILYPGLPFFSPCSDDLDAGLTNDTGGQVTLKLHISRLSLFGCPTPALRSINPPITGHLSSAPRDDRSGPHVAFLVATATEGPRTLCTSMSERLTGRGLWIQSLVGHGVASASQAPHLGLPEVIIPLCYGTALPFPHNLHPAGLWSDWGFAPALAAWLFAANRPPGR